MRLVPNPFGFGNGQNALVDLGWEEVRGGRDDGNFGRLDPELFSLRMIPGHQILTAPIMPRRLRDWGRVGGVKETLHAKIAIWAKRPCGNHLVCDGSLPRPGRRGIFIERFMGSFVYNRPRAALCRPRRSSCRFALRSIRGGFFPYWPSGARCQ